MGGWVKLQLEFFFSGNIFCFCFYVFKCFKKNKMDRGVGVFGLTNPSFSRIFGFVSVAFTCYTARYNMYACSTTKCGTGIYCHTSHSENTTSECEKYAILASAEVAILCVHLTYVIVTPFFPAWMNVLSCSHVCGVHSKIQQYRIFVFAAFVWYMKILL